MTVVTYTNGTSPSTHRRRLTGTAHSFGSHWVDAVRTLRSATKNAVEHAGWRVVQTRHGFTTRAVPMRRSATADDVGSDIIDRIGELDAKALHVLAVVFATLVRTSRRDHQ